MARKKTTIKKKARKTRKGGATAVADATEKPERKNVRRIRELKLQLSVPLTSGERVKKGAALAKADVSLKRLNEEKRIVYGDWRQKIKEARDAADELATELDAGSKQADVLCDVLADLDAKQILTRRLDTGDEFDVRAMNAKEIDEHAQGTMFEHGEGD